MPQLSILHVEDEADIREITAISFAADPDIELRQTSSGVEALEVLANGAVPDVILLDVVMPEIDGPTTLARIRTLSGHESTPVIFLTARTQPQEKCRYIALGAIGVISKPFDLMALGPQIRCMLAEAEL